MDFCLHRAPGVYFENDVAKDIPQEIARGHKIKCHVCGLRGAVLGCYVKRCRKSFHFPCAHTLPCRWDDVSSLFSFFNFLYCEFSALFTGRRPGQADVNYLNGGSWHFLVIPMPSFLIN